MAHKHPFPEGFIWGTATSAHQIEGNNTNSDWWHWEQNKPQKRKWPLEPSGIAADSYNRYEEDFDLAQQLHNNAIRMSVEWARLEPKDGEFSDKEFEHYRKVLRAAKDRGLKTFVTLNHFTLPLWIAQKGGWLNLSTPKKFTRYVKKCAEEFGDLVDVYFPTNESQVYSTWAYFFGVFPPQKKNPFLALLSHLNMRRAHRKSYDAIKAVRDVPVGLVKQVVWYETNPFKASVLDKLMCRALNYLGRDFYIRPTRSKTDLIGLNYYTTYRVKNLKLTTPKQYRSDMGWWINPKGLENILVYLKKYEVPIYITENGLADENDALREQFIRGHLIACSGAIQKGANLKGYFHWSLLDNYEWAEGYWPKFGLVEIDRENNLERKPRKSFYYYADVCKNNSVLH